MSLPSCTDCQVLLARIDMLTESFANLEKLYNTMVNDYAKLSAQNDRTVNAMTNLLLLMKFVDEISSSETVESAMEKLSSK